MSTETTATETKVETIATQPKMETTSTQQSQEVDYEAELAKVNATLEQTKVEKENYRKAYLKNAGGNPPEEDDNSSNGTEDIDSKVKRLVSEQLLATKEAEAQADKDRIISNMAKKLKETTLALKNRGQITTTSGQGSNEEKAEGKVDNVLANDQISALKAKGWSDKKIETFKKNLLTPQLPK